MERRKCCCPTYGKGYKPVLKRVLRKLRIRRGPLLGGRCRRVPLRVMCRSGCLIMVGGPTKVLSIPKGKRVSSICRRVGVLCPSTANPLVIRQLSVTASNILLVTGGGRMRRRLRTRFGGEVVGGQCVTLLSNGVSSGRKAVVLPLHVSPLSEPERMMSRRCKGATVARCRILGRRRKGALVTFCPLAKQARRLEMRTTRPRKLRYPVQKSRLCKRGTSELCLRTRDLRFIRPMAGRVVFMRGGDGFW